MKSKTTNHSTTPLVSIPQLSCHSKSSYPPCAIYAHSPGKCNLHLYLLSIFLLSIYLSFYLSVINTIYHLPLIQTHTRACTCSNPLPSFLLMQSSFFSDSTIRDNHLFVNKCQNCFYTDGHLICFLKIYVGKKFSMSYFEL